MVLQRIVQWKFLVGTLLLGMAAMLVSKLANGTLELYIAGQYRILTILSVAVLDIQLIALWFPQAGSPRPTSHDHCESCSPFELGGALTLRQKLVLLVLTAPVLLGLLLPPKTLGSAAIGKRDIVATVATQATAASVSLSTFGIERYYEPAGEESDPLKRNILQWRRMIFGVRDPIVTFSGQPVNLVGFVHHKPTNPPDQFTLARYVIRCCIADAMALGLQVHTPDASKLPADTWVRVRGVFAPLIVDGQRVLVIEPTRIRPIPQSARPYINGVF